MGSVTTRMARAVQGKIIESQAVALADPHHDLDLRLHVGLVQAELVLGIDRRSGNAGAAVDRKLVLFDRRATPNDKRTRSSVGLK